MKRSEMIKLMMEIIHCDILEDEGFNFWMCDALLSTIESNGMLPPNDIYTNSDDAYLLKHYNKWEDEDEAEFNDHFADLLLKELEQVGMLPPTTQIERKHRKLYPYLDDVWFSEYLGGSQNEWEPEDE